MLDWQLTHGAFAIVIIALGVVAFGGLSYSRSRRWWRRLVPIGIASGIVVAILSTLYVDKIWRPWPDPLPLVVPVAVGLTTTAAILAILHPGGWRRRVVAAVAVLVVALSSFAQVNNHFEAYRSLRQLLGMQAANQVDFGSIAHPTLPSATSPVPPGTAAATTSVGATPTHSTSPQSSAPTTSEPTTRTPTTTEPTTSAPPPAPPPMPANGVVTSVPIPGATSGFPARDAFIYLPPAYARTTEPLPVLVLVAGQPSHPIDWINGGKIPETMDAFAATHNGLAPVVVMVDQLGTEYAHPLCIDSANGNAFSYLTVDVPAWIKANLVVNGDRKKWAIGGMSSGGTCALQLAVTAPAVYPTFIDISGEQEPTIGTHRQTVKEIFGNSEAAFAAINPLDVMARTRFPDTAGVIAAGADDGAYGPAAVKVSAAAQAAGMTINYFQVPGGHTFDVWAAEMAQAMPWLATRLGLTA